jgi:hypothetical protein
MVTIEGLFMEVVSIVGQYLLKPLSLVVEDEVQFRPLNFTQKYLNASVEILWPGKLLSCQCGLHVPGKSESVKLGL